MSTGTDLSPETTFMIDFNAHWVPAAQGLDVPPVAAAAIHNITEAQFSAYLARVEKEVNDTAAGLLGEPDMAQTIGNLPIPQDGTLMAIGDSITTYRFGYARLLQAMFTLRRPNDALRFLNVAQSGYTSTHGLENTYSQFLGYQPDWVFIMFGANDCKRFGGSQAKTLVSPAEYRHNMTGLVEAFMNFTAARLVLLTPCPVIEVVVNHNPDFAAMRMTWDNANIQACAEVVRELAGRHELPLVDLMDAFGTEPDPALYLPDGLHPGPEGHRLIVERVVAALG